jgi:hypothetical protein
MHRERTVTRGEKNRVATALVGLVKMFPNEKFWKLAKPTEIEYINPDTGMLEVVPGAVGE